MRLTYRGKKEYEKVNFIKVWPWKYSFRSNSFENMDLFALCCWSFHETYQISNNNDNSNQEFGLE